MVEVVCGRIASVCNETGPKMRQMRRILLLTLLLSGSVVADEGGDSSAEPITLGVGPYFQSQPYKGADVVMVPTPVVFFDNRLFYVRWTRIGMYLAGGDDWGLSITAQPRPFGYRPADSDVLVGMQAREDSWEAGFALVGHNELGFAELTLFSDVMNHSNGTLGRLELGKVVKTGRWTLVPSFMAIHFDRAFNDYYYGVTKDEATVTRPAYHAGQGFNFALQTFVNYKLSSDWNLQANLRLDYLNETISKSPMVDSDWMVSGMLALAYSLR